jgi:LysR family transcriptional regulator, regulator for bpeEF and oprC
VDRLIAMQTFARVAELGSFSKAADALKLPNATVSTRIAQLEDHLQVKLLARTTRRVSLTDSGVVYLERVKWLLNELGETESQLAGAAQNPRGRLRVDVPAAAGRRVLAPALPDFLARYPGITLELGSSDRPVDLIAEGVDCVVRAGLLHDEQLVARPLGAFSVVTCAAPSYLARHGTPRSPDELSQHHAVNFFSAKTGHTFAFDFERDGRAFEVPVPHRVSANDADTHLALTLAGLGIAQSPRSLDVAGHIEAGRLVPILTDWGAGSLALYAMYPRNRYLSASVRVFVDWIVELYRRTFERLDRADG